MDHLTGHARLAPYQRDFSLGGPDDLPAYATNLAEIKGHEHVRHALAVAAAASHNMMMIGPPGADKTLLARSMPSILPVSP